MRRSMGERETGTSDISRPTRAGELPWQILRVDHSLPPQATGLVNPKSGVFAPALVQKVNLSVRERRPYQSGESIDPTAKLVLHCRSLSDDYGCLPYRRLSMASLVPVRSRGQGRLAATRSRVEPAAGPLRKQRRGPIL